MRVSVASAALLAALTVLGTGCSRSVDGTPRAAAPGVVESAPVSAPPPSPSEAVVAGPGEPDTGEAAALALEQLYDAVAIGDFGGACDRIDPVALGWTPETCPAQVLTSVGDAGYDLSALTVDRARLEVAPGVVRVPGASLQVDGVDSPSTVTYEMRRVDGIWRLSAVLG